MEEIAFFKPSIDEAETALIKVDRDDSQTPAPTAAASARPS